MRDWRGCRITNHSTLCATVEIRHATHKAHTVVDYSPSLFEVNSAFFKSLSTYGTSIRWCSYLQPAAQNDSMTEEQQLQEQHQPSLFVSASPYQDNRLLCLPVVDLDEASKWYSYHFDMTEVERCPDGSDDNAPRVVLERDGVRLGFAVNGGDASQEGAAIQVSNISKMRDELESRGAKIANWRVDERDGKKLQVFFVAAPDGLCYYFYEPIDSTAG